MPHAIWRGSISFGLVSIPVSVMPATEPHDLTFHMLDRRDLAPVHNKRVNSATGSEVAWDDVVKGYQLDDGGWVVVTEDDLRAANVEATQTIDVLAAVEASRIHPEQYDKPYYLQPEKAGRKAYALLRETLARSGRVALAKVVIRTRQHLAAIVPDGDVLLLEVLRYPYEFRATSELDIPGADLAKEGVSEAEIALAEQLVATISRPYDPDSPEYRDTYRDDVLALISKKAAGGAVAAPPPQEEAPATEVVDIVDLLKRSLDEAKKARA